MDRTPPVVTRFAPSPTGFLHVGNARTALFAWFAARAAGGRFILRIDDTDTGRGSAAHEAAIIEDLRWLGLDWDDFFRQSDRRAAHDAALDRLKQDGRLYPCWETPEELAQRRRLAIERGQPPVYDRAALRLSPEERARRLAAGDPPHWRFRLADGEITWTDRVRGTVRFRSADLSDPVLLRADGTPLYHIGSVVDDIASGVTLVIRGEDHVANTAVHIQLFEALGARPPEFAHLPLLVDAAGEGISKRLGGSALRDLRDGEGIEPMAVASLLATIGTAEPVAAHADLNALVARFNFERIGRAPPRYDPAELLRLNAALLHATPFAAVRERLVAMGLGEIDEAGWTALRPNLARLRDIADWWRIVTGPVALASGVDEHDRALIGRALALLPPEPWDDTTWQGWTAALSAETGRRGRRLFLPLRLALTGRDHGPEMRALLPLLGRERAAARLAAAVTSDPSTAG